MATVSYNKYLDGFIEPSIDGVPVATSSMDHL